MTPEVEETWELVTGFSNTQVIGDFAKEISVSSGKIHIGIHFRKNEKRGLERVNMVTFLEEFCYKVEERNEPVSNWRVHCG